MHTVPQTGAPGMVLDGQPRPTLPTGHATPVGNRYDMEAAMRTLFIALVLVTVPLDPTWTNPTPTNPPSTIDPAPVYPTSHDCPDWMHGRCY
jgi:hypothetical protein